MSIAARLATVAFAAAGVAVVSLLFTSVIYMEMPGSGLHAVAQTAVAGVVASAWALLADRWAGPSLGALAGVAAALAAQVAQGTAWAAILPPAAAPAPPSSWLGPLAASAGCAILAAAPRTRRPE